MGDVFTYLETHYKGILLLLLIAFCAGVLLNWVMWIFSWGRYQNQHPTVSTNKEGTLVFVFVTFLVKVIDEFRNLLALILVFIFAAALVYAMVKSGGKSEDLSKSLQAVMSTLGGLVGSIVGYYFGESKARSIAANGNQQGNTALPAQTTSPPVQQNTQATQVVPPPLPMPPVINAPESPPAS